MQRRKRANIICIHHGLEVTEMTEFWFDIYLLMSTLAIAVGTSGTMQG